MLASYTDPFPTSLPYESAISGKVPIRDASVTPAELFKARRERKKLAPDFLGDNDRTLTVTGVSSATEPCRTVTLLQRFPVCPGTVPLPALTGP